MRIHPCLFVVVAAFVLACSSSSSSGGTTDATTDGNTDSAGIDPMNCVPPGTKGNEKGLGGYCSPGGGECNYAAPGGHALPCSADFSTPPHAWFCTTVCNVDSDCGSGEFCSPPDPATHEKGCVPNTCRSLEDAGLGDTSSDATSD
jgi:hypothetical protein